MCIMHLIRCASWSRDAEDELSRPKDAIKRGLLRKAMLMDELKDGWPEQVSDQKPIAKWTSSNKH
jgi:hypothetical protein